MSKPEKLGNGIEYSSNQKGISNVDRSGVAYPTKKVLKPKSTKNNDMAKTQHIELISNMTVQEIIEKYVR